MTFGRENNRLYAFAKWLLALAVVTSCPLRSDTIHLGFVIVDGANPNIARDLTYARRIYEQAPFDIKLDSLQHSTTLPTVARVGGAGDNTETFLKDSTWSSPALITVWYVQSTYLDDDLFPGIAFANDFCLLPTPLGCGWTEHRFGIALSDGAVNDSLARLIGFVITDFEQGPSDPKNLLSPFAIHESPDVLNDVYPNGARLDEINANQAAVMRAFVAKLNAPEFGRVRYGIPSYGWLLGITGGLAGMLSVRRHSLRRDSGQ
jgi:hypothetical protein